MSSRPSGLTAPKSATPCVRIRTQPLRIPTPKAKAVSSATETIKLPLAPEKLTPLVRKEVDFLKLSSNLTKAIVPAGKSIEITVKSDAPITIPAKTTDEEEKEIKYKRQMRWIPPSAVVKRAKIPPLTSPARSVVVDEEEVEPIPSPSDVHPAIHPRESWENTGTSLQKKSVSKGFTCISRTTRLGQQILKQRRQQQQPGRSKKRKHTKVALEFTSPPPKKRVMPKLTTSSITSTKTAKPRLAKPKGKKVEKPATLVKAMESATSEDPLQVQSLQENAIEPSSSAGERSPSPAPPEPATTDGPSSTSTPKSLEEIRETLYANLKEFDAINNELKILPGVKDYCVPCAKQFAGRRKFVDHVRYNHLDRRFRCELCPIRFIKQSDLLAHIKTHFVCKVDGCWRHFLSHKELYDHQAAEQHIPAEDL